MSLTAFSTDGGKEGYTDESTRCIFTDQSKRGGVFVESKRGGVFVESKRGGVFVEGREGSIIIQGRLGNNGNIDLTKIEFKASVDEVVAKNKSPVDINDLK